MTDNWQTDGSSGQPAVSVPVGNDGWDTWGDDVLNSEPNFIADETEYVQNYSAPVWYSPPPPVVQSSNFQLLSKEMQNQQIGIVLASLRQSGVGFPKISETIEACFGVKISPNALVKRFGKLQKAYLEPLSEAVKNAMPELVATVKDEMARADMELPEAEKKAMEEVLKQLPQMITGFVQRRAIQMRKGMSM